MLIEGQLDVVQMLRKVAVLVLNCTRERNLTNLAPKDQDLSSRVSGLLINRYDIRRCVMLGDSMDSEIVPA